MVSKWALGISLGLGARLLGCTPSASSSTAPVTSSAGAIHDAPRLVQSAPSTTPIASVVATPTDAPPPDSPAPPHTGPLGRFHDALRELEQRRRKEHVRIVWLGDSHAQADFWTGGVRSALQQRFGNAGPGFVHLGMDHYRHDDVEFVLKGSWRMRPKQPSSVERWGDGAFGLGGILNAGYAGKRIAGMRIVDPDLAGNSLRWDLCYKPATARDRFDVTFDATTSPVVATQADVNAVHHLAHETHGAHRLEVHVLDGGPDFCGVWVTTDAAVRPGVVLDNLGINGARYATALAWDEKAWAAELVRRPTDLFVFEFGGNEASDGVIQPESYRKNALELVKRAKRAAPDAACLIIGPADRADRESQIPPIVAALHRASDEAGCAFWDTWKTMGGRGSLDRWRADRKASPDGVHLVPKGYAELAALLTQDLLAGYRKD